MKMFADSSLPSLDEGSYSAVLNGVIWLGLQAQDKRDAEKYGPKGPTYRLKLLFEIPERTNKFGEVEVVGKTIKNVTTNVKGGFITIASNLVGKKMQSAELAKYLSQDEPLKELLGKQVTVNMAHFNSDDGLKSYVESVVPAHPKDDPVKGTKDTVYFNPAKPDMAEWDKLTYYTKNDIMKSVEAGRYSDELQKAWVRDQESEAVRKQEKDANKADYSKLA